MKPYRYFILGPLIIGLAFTLHDRRLALLQIFAGAFYFSLGFLHLKCRIDRDHTDRFNAELTPELREKLRKRFHERRHRL